jgi:hypothetical protein
MNLQVTDWVALAAIVAGALVGYGIRFRRATKSSEVEVELHPEDKE